MKKLSKSDRSKREKDADNQYHEATKKGIGGQSSGIDASNHLPPYIKRESPEEEHWLEQHPDGWEPVSFILCVLTKAVFIVCVCVCVCVSLSRTLMALLDIEFLVYGTIT